MRKPIILPLMILLLAVSSMQAQQGRFRRANRYFAIARYDKAIQLYREVLFIKPGHEEAQVFLAEAYRKTHQYELAEAAYGEVVDGAAVDPIHHYHYGEVLLQNEKCEAAMVQFRRYLEKRPEDPRRAFLLRACEYRKELFMKNSGKYRLRYMEFNTAGNDFGAAYYRDGLIYASAQKGKGRHPFLDLFYVAPLEALKSPGETLAQPEPLSQSLNSSLHEAVVTFTPDENVIYFTRSRKVSGRAGRGIVNPLEIVYAQRLGNGQWSDLKELPFNSDFYSVAHPCLTSDGRGLFFSSDMPGGVGGKDIYFSRWEEGQWSPPLNLGPEINTERDEVFPFYSEDGRLYFASDGHFGLGGLDIYGVDWQSGELWSEVVNLGYPINTTADDFGLIYDKTSNLGFLSSNRPGGAGGDDLYCFDKVRKSALVLVADAGTGAPLEDVKVSNFCAADFPRTSGAGLWALDIETGDCCEFSFEKATYLPRVIKICADGPFDAPLPVLRIGLEADDKLHLRGRVIDAALSEPLAGAVVSIRSDSCVSPEPVITDKNGYYEFRLEAGCCYSLRAEKGNFFARTLDDLICTPEEGALTPSALDVFLQPFLITARDRGRNISGSGRRIVERHPGSPFAPSHKQPEGDSTVSYLINIYYDFGKTAIRQDALPELLKLKKLLLDNPNLIVEVSSHTDARGSSDYNRRLSQKRADEVIAWLHRQGVEPGRLVARGYGEDRLVNPCDDGVPCSEREHQQNRRTEFRVIGKKI